MTHSANRLKKRYEQPFSKSYSSFTGMPFHRKYSDSYSFNNNTFNDDTSGRDLMRELGVVGKLDPSSGGNSTKMVEYRPGSFILTNKNHRSYNSTNYNCDNRSNEGVLYQGVNLEMGIQQQQQLYNSMLALGDKNEDSHQDNLEYMNNRR